MEITSAVDDKEDRSETDLKIAEFKGEKILVDSST